MLAGTALVVLVTGFAPTAKADIIPSGSSLTFGGYNLPGACTDTSCSDTVTFGSTYLIDGGALSLTTSEVADGPNAAWDVFSIATVGGGPIAGDINGDWNITMDYDLSAPVDFEAVVTQWTVNGTPVSPLSNFSGICCASATNPSPISGEAYYNSGFTSPLPAGVESDWQEIFIDPYSLVEEGGIDPSTANGFNFALYFTLQTPSVPEPGSLALSGIAFAGVAVLYRRRRRAS